MIMMPGSSHKGPLPPKTATEAEAERGKGYRLLFNLYFKNQHAPFSHPDTVTRQEHHAGR
jgi:hypothetical protein